MTNLLRAAGGVLALAMPAWAAEDFSQRISAQDFAAAGLSKLTPEELARLDALVRAERNGEIAQVRAETEEKVKEETTKRVREETTAKVKAEMVASAPKEAEGGGLFHRLRVKLRPGTDIEYAAEQTELVGRFRGYEPGTVLSLANGQKWRVVEGSYWSPAREAEKVRKVTVEPGALGSFFMEIEGVGRPKVKLVSNPE